MLRALDEFRVEGVDTTIPFFRLLLSDDTFKRGDYATPDVDSFTALHRTELQRESRSAVSTAGARAAQSSRMVTVEVNDQRFDVRVFGFEPQATPRENPSTRAPKFKPQKKIAIDGRSVPAPMHGILAEVKTVPGDSVRDGQVVAIIEAMKMMNEVIAHRAGLVESIDAKVGETVEAGQPLLTFAP